MYVNEGKRKHSSPSQSHRPTVFFSCEMNHHTGDKWLIHATNYHKDIQLQSLKYPCRLSSVDNIRDDSGFAPIQWETALLCIDVFHWLGVNLEPTLIMKSIQRSFMLTSPICCFKRRSEERNAQKQYTLQTENGLLVISTNKSWHAASEQCTWYWSNFCESLC